MHSFCTIQVCDGGRVTHFIDGHNAMKSNWLRYANCASSWEMQNLSANQIDDQIYYSADKDIEPNTELLVWYGDNYAQELGLISRNSRSSYLTVHGM